jgi:FkbM family methyltransferase
MDLVLNPKGILHLGGGQAEELDWYNSLRPQKVLWIEANIYTLGIIQNKIKDYPHHSVVHALLDEIDDQDRNFYITNNFGSSSMLPLHDHKIFYPTVHVKHIVQMKGTTVDTLLHRLSIEANSFDMANLDLQGAELIVLRGMKTVLPCLKWIFIEVNFKEMYKGCALVGEVNKLLTENGFKLTNTTNTGMGWGECVYVK